MDKIILLALLCVAGLQFAASKRGRKAGKNPDGCPDGWSFRSGACYRAYETDTPKWADAQAQCRKIGADLVRITSEEENEYVVGLAKKFASSRSKLWIGLERDCDDDKFYWVDGTGVDYANWMEGQPDNFGGVENCGHLYLTGEREGQWNDRPCDSPDESIGFICQKECQNGWSYFDGDCYRVEFENGGWRDAVQKCADQVAELAEPKKPTVNAYLADLGANHAPAPKLYMWIGMNRDCDRKFRWLNGKAPKYTNWREGQPDDWRSSENCAHMYLTGENKGEWNDINCKTAMAFACQKDDKRLPRFKTGKE